MQKQTFALESILTFSKLTNTSAKAKLALIEITAAETLKEVAQEIAAVKTANQDKYQPGDWSAGIRAGVRSGGR
jgi:hypothetical protein